MKKVYLAQMILLVFLIMGCNYQKPNEISLDKYFTLKYDSYEKNGETINIVRPVIKEQSDSIGVIIDNRKRSIDYLLTNFIDSDTLNKLLPDSTRIEIILKKEIAKDSFDFYVKRIIFPNMYEKQEFSHNEMMNIASKFFLVEKRGNRGLGARICSTANGLPESQNTDYTLLEAFVFDAIFSKMQQGNLSKVNFLNNANSYLKESISDNPEIKSLDSLEIISRNFVFRSMEKDVDLIQNLSTFYETNKHNIPIIIGDKL